MKKSIWLGIAGIVVAVGAVSLIALPRGPEWTTSSPAALEEFELAMDAQMKLYHADASVHLQRAVDLDPDFVMAKMMLAEKINYDDKEAASEMFDEVMASDLDALTARERMMVRRLKAYRNEDREEADRILDEYLEKHPDDPIALNNKANQMWQRGDTEVAERLYRRLVEISPNWVIAYNQLGYITMLQGRFAEAEEYFTSYRFIAPDQANPHDSLGELYIILGRYEDAVGTLEKALAIKADFEMSYMHLMTTHTLMQDFNGGQAVIERARDAGLSSDRMLESMDCLLRYSELAADESWQLIVDEAGSGCLESAYTGGYPALVTHRAASVLGEWEMADAIEAKVQEMLDKAKQDGSAGKFDDIYPRLLHMQGVRAAIEGRLDDAVQQLRQADAHLTFREVGVGIFKLYNQMMLAEVLLAQGGQAEAHKLLSRARTVNPEVVAEFEEAGLSFLGLSRS